MSRMYDSRTTIFSPEGRLYQVEYAMEAISQAGSAVGILANDGVVLAAEKRILSKLLDVRKGTEKTYVIDDHVAFVFLRVLSSMCLTSFFFLLNSSVAVAGISSDANILITRTRQFAQQYRLKYQEPIPIEQLLQMICDVKQSYTQFGGLRPFGVSFLFAGWDEHYGFQLYQSDPSGNYGGWKASAIGANNQAAQSILKSDYKIGETTLEDALLLAVKVLGKTMDTSTPTPDKLEFSTITRDAEGNVVYEVLSKAKLQDLLKDAESKGMLVQSADGSSSTTTAATTSD
eukprot:TRINITY_DN1605_c0_g1_i1.p2 TRINITY_DN1605_c0_g1~~TRINITY_DN1605_c0_g1_i1.p2  ORF type:complete len:288 (-),score=90.08 TRINITY_DN1605_c0_g1_i1:1286-2149(-)